MSRSWSANLDSNECPKCETEYNTNVQTHLQMDDGKN